MAEHSRARDMARLLPLLGGFLLLPFVLSLINGDGTLRSIHGVPLLPVYLFGLWFLLISLTRDITRSLQKQEHESADEAPPPAQPEDLQ